MKFRLACLIFRNRVSWLWLKFISNKMFVKRQLLWRCSECYKLYEHWDNNKDTFEFCLYCEQCVNCGCSDNCEGKLLEDNYVDSE